MIPKHWRRKLPTHLEEALRDLAKTMKDSAFMVSILKSTIDGKIICETGAGVLLDKPIILVVIGGAEVPMKLRRVVDELIEADSMTQAAPKLEAAITIMQARLEPGGDLGPKV
jgi:hypothetical protein